MTTWLDVLVQVKARQLGIQPSAARAYVIGTAKANGMDLCKLQLELSQDQEMKVRLFLQENIDEITKHVQLEQALRPSEEVDAESRLISSYVLKELAQQRSMTPSPKLPMKHFLRSIGIRLWDHSYAQASDDAGAFVHLANFIMSLPMDYDDNVSLHAALNSDLRTHYLAAARWADSAFPVVQLAGHKYAAAMMSTSPNGWDDIRPPWQAFMIDLPTDLLRIEMEGEEASLCSIMVWHHVYEGRMCWSIIGYTMDGCEIHSHSRTTSELLDLKRFDKEPPITDAFSVPLDSRDERTIMVLARLVLNVCIAMSNPDDVKKLGSHPKWWTKGPGRISREPLYRTFRVGKPVVVDCRPALTSFLLNPRKSSVPTVQFIVRGHWRNQACGPHMSQRRATWIEPYWKGPDDGPINVRPHYLKESP